MSHNIFAKIDENYVVVQVETLADESITTEAQGQAFLHNLYKDSATWIETFTDGTRGNFAGVDLSWDPVNNVFLQIKPFDSWVLNTTTWKWDSPIPRPANIEGYIWVWNEEAQQWEKGIEQQR